MTREDQIKKATEIIAYGCSDKLKAALIQDFPELRESEDERIIKTLQEYVKNRNWPLNGPTQDEALAWLDKQKEQKPNIELIQRSWYMEGYHDREFGKEPKWILKTGEGGPKHELNPRYGEYIKKEQKPVEWSEEEKEKIRQNGRLDVCYNPEKYGLCHKIEWSEEDEENFAWFDKFFRAESVVAGGRDIPQDKYLWFKSLRPVKQEWSEEDEKMLNLAIEWAETMSSQFSFVDMEPTDFRKIASWLKSLRPQPHKEIYQAARHDLAIRFMNYLDENRPDGKMGLSNGECEDIDKAFNEVDWAKIMRYYEKYRPSWKPSEHQMTILKAVKEYVGRGSGYWGEGLSSLIEDLEKL